MPVEVSVEARAGVHAALGDPARLRIVDALHLGDASPSDLAALLAMSSNLLAHHLNKLETAGVVSRHRSEGDGRRSYLRLAAPVAEFVAAPPMPVPERVVFVCTANSARSHLAAALWRAISTVPTTSAGTHPAAGIARGAIAVAERHDLDLPDVAPRELGAVTADGDLLVTVCDRAHEVLGDAAPVHWSVPDPVRAGTRRAFDTAYDQLAARIALLSHRFAPRPEPSTERQRT